MTRLIPRPAATLVLARDGAAGLEVFMLERSSRADFVAGAYVFPGGAIDAEDSSPEVIARVLGLDDSQASRRLQLPAGGLAYYVAAARECFEEAGILLTVDERGTLISPDRVARLTAERDALNAGTLSFLDLLKQERQYIATDHFAYFAHWITSPGQSRRYSTRFFVALAPEGQLGSHDDGETVSSIWTRPQEALDRHAQGQIELVFPTRSTLIELARHASSAEVFSAVAEVQDDVETDAACYAIGSSGRRLFRRTDPAYAEIHWCDPEECGETTYDLTPGIPKRLDRWVTRIVAPNPGIMTGPGTNTYLIGEEGLAVIDPGPDIPEHIETILNFAGDRIRWVLVTHTHPDHSPAAAVLKEATGARLIGLPAPAGPSQDATFIPDWIPADGERLELGPITLRAIATPGHASNHLCYLLEDTGMLFTGDLVMQGSTVVISPPDGNMSDYLESLERLLALELAVLAPGHGYLIGLPAKELRKLIRHRQQREAKVVQVLSQLGRAAPQELVREVYDDVPEALHPVAVRSLVAHLEKLSRDGAAHVIGGSWGLVQPKHA